MTNAEQKTIDNLYKLLSDIQTENNTFKRGLTEKVEKIQKQVDATYLLANLEAEILQTAQTAISNAITVSLASYNSPLVKLVEIVVNENIVSLKSILTDNFTKAIVTQEFKEAVRSAFIHKIAKNLVSGADSLFSKTMNDLKQDSVFKAKMILAVEKVIEEQTK